RASSPDTREDRLEVAPERLRGRIVRMRRVPGELALLLRRLVELLLMRAHLRSSCGAPAERGAGAEGDGGAHALHHGAAGGVRTPHHGACSLRSWLRLC